MAHIRINEGLDIPISGKPLLDTIHSLPQPIHIALSLDPFEDIKFKLLAKTGQVVKHGEPLLYDKSCPDRKFVSPASGFIKEVRRGLKRRILDVIIEVDQEEQFHEHAPLNVDTASREEIINRLLEGGLFAHIYSRPFNILANPEKVPRSIFVKALESAPFVPPTELQVAGNEKDFQTGLTALSKLTDGDVHLVFHHKTPFEAFVNAQDVKKHTAEGPHPVSNHSVHIHHIDPIETSEDTVWTITAYDVIAIGHLLNTGRYFTDRVISIAGPGIVEGRQGYFKARAGYPVNAMISDRVDDRDMRFVSGDPLNGFQVHQEDFLGFHHFTLSVIPENIDREFLHFFRLGVNKFTFSRAYVSGLLDNSNREYDFSTNQHGEHRAFVDPTLYDKVMPIKVPTMQLVKSVMAQDFDLAEELGLLEVDAEDFALPTFVCPSKMEMIEIIKNGLKEYAKEVLE